MTLATTRSLLAMSLGCILALGLALASPPPYDRFVVAGVLQSATPDSCVVLATPYGFFLLDDYEQFAVGDSVVAAADCYDDALCGAYGYPHLPDNIIGPLRDCDCGCGVLSANLEYNCWFVDTERFGSVALDSHSGFTPGDTVHVVGDFLINCITISECSANCCLERNTTTACTLTPASPTSWGAIKGLFR
jgi:hypothetical protein